MTDLICISHPKKVPISSWISRGGQVEKGVGKLSQWKSKEYETPTIVSCTLSFDDLEYFNSIHIKLHNEFSQSFPSKLRFEFSVDKKNWEPLLHEHNFKVGPNNTIIWNFALVSAKFLKIVLIADKKNQSGKFMVAIGEMQTFISGVTKITASSELDRLWVKENIIDRRSEYGWSSSPKVQQEKEFIELDFGAVNRITEVHILTKDDVDTFFPNSFRLLYSEDNITWRLLFDENHFIAEPACWYKWRFLPTNARYVQLVILEGARTSEGKYISQIVEVEFYAITNYLESPHHSHSLPPVSTTLNSGIVRLASDGEYKEGVAVQASDKRLLEATTEKMGIIKLAMDGEVKESLVVQSIDRRLKNATEDLHGIVRLARNGEVKEGHVVQSNDARLSKATEDSFGIVELAVDGESRAGVVVQGNDRRLKLATISSPGIVKLASNGGENPNEAIQADDYRLKNATTEKVGLMRFAKHGEVVSDKAVQSDDPRLKDASTEIKGVVILAKNGEKKAGKVVQSNDTRLDESSTNNFGIVQLASLGSSASNRVVQANDPRLSDARQPVNHEHDYAPKDHDFNSHKGTLQVKTNQGNPFKGDVVPVENYAAITGINQEGAGVIGRGGREGVIGSGTDCGVGAFGIKNGVGLLATSKKNAAGRFFSENSYSIITGGNWKERELQSSKLSFLAQGLSRFNSDIYSFVSSGCIASFFTVKAGENISMGDVVVIDESGKSVSKSSGYGNLRIVGVAVPQASLILNPPENILPNEESDIKGPFTYKFPQDKVLVAIGGIVEVTVNADKAIVKAGDLMVSSTEAGVAQSLDQERYKMGMVFGKSITALEKGRSKIKVILSLGL